MAASAVQQYLMEEIPGTLQSHELESSRKLRIAEGNRALAAVPGDTRLGVAPVSANGECFVRSLAVEMQHDELLVDCRTLYVYMMECVMKNAARFRNCEFEESHIQRVRFQTIRAIPEYSDITASMKFDIYCLDKLEGLFQCEGGILDRNYCEEMEIVSFLRATGANALFLNPTPGQKHKAFLQLLGDFIHVETPFTEDAPAENYDLVFLHYQAGNFQHYDPVYFLATCQPWALRATIQRRILDAVQSSELCAAHRAGDMWKLRAVALRLLRTVVEDYSVERPDTLEPAGADGMTDGLSTCPAEANGPLHQELFARVESKKRSRTSSDATKKNLPSAPLVDSVTMGVTSIFRGSVPLGHKPTRCSADRSRSPRRSASANNREDVKPPAVEAGSGSGWEAMAERYLREHLGSMYGDYFDCANADTYWREHMEKDFEEEVLEERQRCVEQVRSSLKRYPRGFTKNVARRRSKEICDSYDDPVEEEDPATLSNEDDDGKSEISSNEEGEDALKVVVEPDKHWITYEDMDNQRAQRLALHLRERPLMPPHPDDASKSWGEATSGISLPKYHCAFKNCTWTSTKLPCEQRSLTKDSFIACEGAWLGNSKRDGASASLIGCCGNSSCLREHIVQCHADALRETCTADAVEEDSYDYYLEAIKIREQQAMPIVGPSVDRRTFAHVAQDMSEDAIQSLICMCCAQLRRSSNTTNADIARVNSGEYFKSLCPVSFQANWDFAEYMKHYGSTDVLQNHPDLQDGNWTWRRQLTVPKFQGRVILCAPEDVTCSQTHNYNILCENCTFPLCFECNTKSRFNTEAQCRIPEALANDNFTGYVSSIIYKYKVRWIECVAASPVFTSLITYYVEGDRGHLLGERQHVPAPTGETECRMERPCF